MFKLFFNKISTTTSIILGCISLFLFGRNAKLSRDNDKLNKDIKKQSKIIDVQEKVINVTKNTKDKPIDGNIKRMRKNKL